MMCLLRDMCICYDTVLGQISTEGAEREFAEITEFRQKKGEKHADFMRRMDTTTMNVIKESQIEASFKVNTAGQNSSSSLVFVFSLFFLKLFFLYKKTTTLQTNRDLPRLPWG